jgi:DNA-binding transcriptional LysR family regulator
VERTKLSLNWLEAFRAIARTGSVKTAAASLDLSVSTVSHHLGCLEQALGVALIDHGRRPMALTPAGETLLRRVDESLLLLDKGISEVRSSDPATLVRRLAIASIEDLDVEVTPLLARGLAEALPSCALSFLSRSSHDIVRLLQAEEADLGIASTAEFAEPGLVEAPLLQDPYVLVVPRGRTDGPGAYLDGLTGLAFLRYSKKQLVGRRVETQLRRLRKDIPSSLDFESTQPILSLIAEGQAWTITTALNFASAYRQHDRIRAMPFPEAGFVRRLSLFRREGLPQSLMTCVAEAVRPLVETRIVAPALEREPWLAGGLTLLDE